MDETRYDIYLTGKLEGGTSIEQARTRLAALFKTPVESVAALVDGKPHRLKKDVDETTAKRYLAALGKAGLAAAVKRTEAGTSAPTSTPTSAPSATGGALSLAPAGTPVLAEGERTVFTPVAVDTSGLSLASVFDLPLSRESAPPLAAPDFGLAPPGSLLDNLPSHEQPVNPDTSGLSIAAPGAELLEGVARPAPPPAPDTNHITLE